MARAKSNPVNISFMIILMVFIIMITFLLPFFSSWFSDNISWFLSSEKSNGFYPAWGRTLGFSLASSLLSTLGGLQLALCFRNIAFKSKTGKALSILLLPVLLGDVTISYLFKCSLFGTTFYSWIIEHGQWSIGISLLLIQFWQYGLLFTYLFWLSIQHQSSSMKIYADSIQMSEKERILDITLPSIRNLFVLLFIICFIFSFYEYAKSQFVFKTSQGTDTELLCQFLYRTYQSRSVSDPVIAQSFIYKFGFYLLIAYLLMLSAIGLSLIIGVKRIITKRKAFALLLTKEPHWLPWLCITLTLLPIVIALIRSKYGNTTEGIFELTLPLILTLISSVIAAIYAISFGIASKICFHRILSEFSVRSAIYIMLIFLLQVIPPICLMNCGYKWLSIIGYNTLSIYLVWILGHAVLVSPILGSFVTATHFVVKSSEIDWQIIHQISFLEIIRFGFLRRFAVDYILTFLFAFTFIWNDTILNRILSDEIASFSDKMQRLFIGRAADDAQATLFALVAIIISATCIICWHIVINNRSISNNQDDIN